MLENDKNNIISFHIETNNENLLEKKKEKEEDKNTKPNSKDTNNINIPNLTSNNNNNNNNIEPKKESSFITTIKKIFLNIEDNKKTIKRK